MLSGIEILSQEVVSSATSIPAFILIMFLCLLAIVLSVCLTVVAYREWWHGSAFLGIFLTIAMVILTCFGINKQVNPETHNEYKVLISDEVSWNEFNEKYEVIDQEGKIYTIKEK